MTDFPPEELVGFDLFKFYTKEEADFIVEQRERNYRNRHNRFEFVVPRRNGTRLPVIISAKVVEDPDGRNWVIITFTDISEQKHAEQELRDANRMLEERQREIQEDLLLWIMDIVEASGLEKGTLYGHFSTKEELALLAFDYAWKDTSDKRLRNIDTVSNAVDKLTLHVDNYVNTPSFPGGCPLLNFAADADDGNLALRTRVRKALKGWEDFLATIVEDGQSAEEINPEIDP